MKTQTHLEESIDQLHEMMTVIMETLTDIAERQYRQQTKIDRLVAIHEAYLVADKHRTPHTPDPLLVK